MDAPKPLTPADLFALRKPPVKPRLLVGKEKISKVPRVIKVAKVLRRLPVEKAVKVPSPPAVLPVIVVEDTELKELRNDLVSEFFELSIHAVLFYRELYPSTFFERMTKYDIPVWVAVQPAIRQYVENCIEGIKPALLLDRVSAVTVTILTPAQKIPVERFIFRIVHGNATQEKSKVKNVVGSGPTVADKSTNRDKVFYRLSEALKSFSLRIAACKTYLKPLPPGCSCVLQIVTDTKTQLALASAGDHQSVKFPWVEADDRQKGPIPQGQVQPIRGSTSGICPLEMSVDEARNKFAPILHSIKTTSIAKKS